jgi:hypothetical protein
MLEESVSTLLASPSSAAFRNASMAAKQIGGGGGGCCGGGGGSGTASALRFKTCANQRWHVDRGA